MDIIADTYDGRIDEARQLLMNGADPNTRNSNHTTPLMVAAHRGYYSIADLLIRYDADINAVDIHGNTALLYAIFYGNKDIASLLLRHGAVPNSESFNHAIEQGYEDIVEMMVSTGSIDRSTINNALLYAITDDNIDMVTILYSRGVDNDRPLIAAVRERRATICDILLKNGAKYNVYDSGNYILSIADDMDIVSMLIGAGANVNAVNENNDTQLIHHCMKGSLPIVRILVDNGADIDARNDNDISPLMMACQYRFYDIVDFLLRRGAVVGDALPFACMFGSSAIVRRLLETPDIHAIIDDATYEGRNAMTNAVYHLHPHIVTILVKAGADVNRRDMNGETILLYAVTNIYDPSVYMVNTLIDLGVDVNVHDKEEGKTPLMHAVEGGHYLCAKTLLERGANPNARDNSGNTALMVAAGHDDVDMVTLLLKHGAYTYLKNDEGHTASSLTTSDYIRNLLNIQPSSMYKLVTSKKKKYSGDITTSTHQ